MSDATEAADEVLLTPGWRLHTSADGVKYVAIDDVLAILQWAKDTTSDPVNAFMVDYAAKVLGMFFRGYTSDPAATEEH